MILKKHFINIWIRVIAILVNCFAIAFVSIPQPDWFYIINLLTLLAIQVILFVRSQNSLNREIEKLFDSLENSETTLSFFNQSNNPDFQNIFKRFDKLTEQIQKLKMDSFQKNIYLTTLFEHINIGIITLNNKGEISLKNSQVTKILAKGNINHINDIRKINLSFATAIENIKPDESKLISLYKDGYLQHLLVRAALLKFTGEEIKIISFQNIRSELDNREMEGWQKLIRVLTHELMNSSGPINSTISTILELLTLDNHNPKNISAISQDILNDTIQGLKIIDERSKGMIEFVTRFRSLTLIPSPHLENIELDAIVNNIQVLLSDESEKRGIKILYKPILSGLKLIADKGMIEQIIINLIKNSFEAINQTNNPRINISAWTDINNHVLIDISDNGEGIPQDIQDKIFIPFYTTRKNGTGIGLSLSRQLANIQGGALVLNKSTDQGTTFTLKFNRAY